MLVLPRSSCSPHVFVAHLGKITVTNIKIHDEDEETIETPKAPNQFDRHIFTIDEELNSTMFSMEDIHTITDDVYINDDYLKGFDENVESNKETYTIDVRNMNLFSLDTTTRKGFRLSALPRAEEFYSCSTDAVPVLHDTAIRLEIVRSVEASPNPCSDHPDEIDIVDVTGSVVRPLNLSLSRMQYEQLIDTLENLFKVPSDLVRPPSDGVHPSDLQPVIDVEPRLFQIDDKFKRRLFAEPMQSIDSPANSRNFMRPKVSFELPTFTITLKNEVNSPLIEISFRDFNVNYERKSFYETSIQVSLRSILMEDLLQDPESKHRAMVISSSPAESDGRGSLRSGSSYASRSCPNLVGVHLLDDCISGSLPENLETSPGFPTTRPTCPDTPPPSPQPRLNQDTLVLYSSLIVDPMCPLFDSQYNSIRQRSNIDFNSLDLVVSVQSWFVLLNFFGLLSNNDSLNETQEPPTIVDEVVDQKEGNSELDISVRSLTLVFIRPEYEIAKANVSNAHFIVSKDAKKKSVEGKLGSISLIDLTSYGAVYRERFLTTGNEALNFVYHQDVTRLTTRSLTPDALLRIRMSSVRYVHTKRFVTEIQVFFKEFQQLQMVRNEKLICKLVLPEQLEMLQPVLRKMKPSDSKSTLNQRPTQLELDIKAGSPIILLPLSASSNEVIVADLGEFSLKNSFHLTNEIGVIR